ncbi:class F sortase [Streptomyces sp. NPDC127098]|uniref:class F sortase n=1 Tax=Streptomyces sp. NPDC127098 TaxID=3347137 RepID=UPI003654802B
MRQILRRLRGADRPPRLRVPRAMRKVKPRRTPRTPRDPRKVRSRPEKARKGRRAREAGRPSEAPEVAATTARAEEPAPAAAPAGAAGDPGDGRRTRRRRRRLGSVLNPLRPVRFLGRLVRRPLVACVGVLLRAARWVVSWYRRVARPVVSAARAVKRLVLARPGDGTRAAAARVSRQQRLALRARRLEVAAAASAVTVGLAGGLLLPGSGEVVSEARASSSIAEGVSRPGAVDAPGAAPDAGSTANLDGSEQPSGVVAPPLPRSTPTRIRIPQLGTDVEVFGALLGTDGGPPSPAEEDAMRAAWYSGGVAPGEQGPAILVGHLDTYTGPAAFAGLGQLQPGELIEIDREDGQTALFEVDSVEQYPKADFPDLRVYGAVDTPQLRLITCGGRWTADGGYDSNIVAYARLIGTMAPPATGQ